jgi:integrase
MAAPDCVVAARWSSKDGNQQTAWGDILWDHGKIRVRSTKTEHHEGCEMRHVPIRDVRSYLDAAFAEAEEGSEDVITRFSDTNNNLDKPFKKIIEAAGMIPWAKLFQNLRSSCETQWLKDGERADLVANWIGHSVKVQRMNYVQETEEDIEAFNRRTAFVAVKKATQKATQNPLENDGTARKTKTKATHYSK